MKGIHLVLVFIMSLAAAPLASFAADQRAESASGKQPAAHLVKRGRYLVKTIGCGDCHTPKKFGPQGPVEDESLELSGHPEGSPLPAPPSPTGPWIVAGTADLTAWAGPWGISFAINLTPDENTGIGIWTEEMFVKAIKTGRHMGVSRQILPPMPIHSLQQLTDEDLRSIYAYLRTIKPISNRIPDPVPPTAPPKPAKR